MIWSRYLRVLSLVLPALGLMGCFGPLAARLADKEAYPIIARSQAETLGASEPFTIENEESELTHQIMESAVFSSDPFTTGGVTISLAEALAIGIDNNREYQTRKEQLYLTALALTEERHEFSPIFSGVISAFAARDPALRTVLVERTRTVTDPVSGLQQDVVETVAEERLGAERTRGVDARLGVTKLFATGARVTVGLTTNFLRFTTGEGNEIETGALSGTIIQPLLQGAGTDVALENLRQAERDLVYAVRDFARYQKDFVIERINDYFRLLQARDLIENERRAYDRLIITRKRAEAFQAAERMAPFEVDQARQDEIAASYRWVNAQTEYALLLDQFKIDLGLPPNLLIQPDTAELNALREMGLIELQYNLDEAQELALSQRLDLETAQMQVADADRRIAIAENSLLPVLDAQVDYSIANRDDGNAFDLTNDLRSYQGSLVLELPFDRKLQRNDFRRALISREARRREAEELRSEIMAAVRSAYLRVDEARKSFDIQIESERLALRRVANVEMLLDLGREDVSIRDRLEAESALRSAQNSVTRELVNFLIARLNFYNAIEQLHVDEQGMWYENAKDAS